MNSRSIEMLIRFARRLLAVGAASLLMMALSAAAPKPDRDAVTFSVPSGVFTNELLVELKTAEPAVIRFTMDGTEPKTNSPGYNSPIEISQSIVMRARAFYPDGRVSSGTSQSYVLLGNDVRRFSSHLPLIVVNIAGDEMEAGEKSFAGLHVLEN